MENVDGKRSENLLGLWRIIYHLNHTESMLF